MSSTAKIEFMFIVTSTNMLEEIVNDRLQSGWCLYGQPFATGAIVCHVPIRPGAMVTRPVFEIAQAMIRQRNET